MSKPEIIYCIKRKSKEKPHIFESDSSLNYAGTISSFSTGQYFTYCYSRDRDPATLKLFGALPPSHPKSLPPSPAAPLTAVPQAPLSTMGALTNTPFAPLH